MIQKVELIKDSEQVNQLYEFIKKMPLDYPDYNLWVEKCKRELELGNKKGLVIRDQDKIIAEMIFQPHKDDNKILEIKSARVDENYRGRGYFGIFLAEAEKYARKNGLKRIMIDCHSDQMKIVETTLKYGFSLESNEKLYNDKLESILVKDISGEEKWSILQYLQKNISYWRRYSPEKKLLNPDGTLIRKLLTKLSRKVKLFFSRSLGCLFLPEMYWL